MDEIERAESPLLKNRLPKATSQEISGDSDAKEAGTKKRSGISKRKARNVEKENGDVNVETNGDLSTNEDQISRESVEMKEVNGSGTEQNVAENNDQNGVNRENSDSVEEESKDHGDVEEKKSVNGDVNFDSSASETKETLSDANEGGSGTGVRNESMNVDTEESYVSADTESIPMDRMEGSDQSPKNTDPGEDKGVAEPEVENGQEVNGNADVEAKAPLDHTEKRGFFGKWSFGLTAEKKEPETNGHADEINPCELYYSSITGRRPLNRGTPNATTDEKESVVHRKGVKTPSNLRTLDDSFGVKSEPPRTNRGESKDRPNLRKFPAKRCLNADESDEKSDSFLSHLTFTKRRKIDEDKTRTGFLRSFLWSPFRKRSIPGNDEVTDEESNTKTAIAKPSWFRSPFWFWKRCNREEERN